MSKYTMKVVKGVTAGVAAGLIVGYVGKTVTNDRKHLKKKTSHALDTMSDMLDTVSYMFK